MSAEVKALSDTLPKCTEKLAAARAYAEKEAPKPLADVEQLMLEDTDLDPTKSSLSSSLATSLKRKPGFAMENEGSLKVARHPSLG